MVYFLKLIHAAMEACVEECNASVAVVKTLNVRNELVEWYKRVGFQETEEIIPTSKYAMQTLVECHFVVLKKELPKSKHEK